MSSNTKKKTNQQPINNVEWVSVDDVQPNDYNPNHQAPPESKLLKISILKDGWTQPIVCFDDGEKLSIVDGEHRWRTAKDPEIAKATGGMIPIVRIKKSKEERMYSTIRHNRARGEHDITQMANIVKMLIESKRSPNEICELLQMEDEEVERLAEYAGLPDVVCENHGDKFGNAWVPDKSIE